MARCANSCQGRMSETALYDGVKVHWHLCDDASNEHQRHEKALPLFSKVLTREQKSKSRTPR